MSSLGKFFFFRRMGVVLSLRCIADRLGISDNDPRVEWRYAQERGKPKEYAARVEITAAMQAATLGRV